MAGFVRCFEIRFISIAGLVLLSCFAVGSTMDGSKMRVICDAEIGQCIITDDDRKSASVLADIPKNKYKIIRNKNEII